MTKKTIGVLAAAVMMAGAAGLVIYKRADAKSAVTYRTAAVQTGDIQASVSATGALSAVTTVQVGTQVSGQVAAIYADFNQQVKKGQLLARIDPTLQQQAVADAQSGVERANAQLAPAKSQYDREKAMFDQRIVTATEFETAQSAYAVAEANLKSAQIALDKARQNLSYTSIYAPIDGVIVERNVDVGQTVAASLSAPQLFLIANDLSQMQILANVAESDIGQITTGLPVRFTVQTYQNQTFDGVVKQVRLQSTTADNVVNYTAVVSVENPKGKLLPGMTATVQFVTGSAKNALLVPNAALRFQGPGAVAATPAASAPANAAAAATTPARTGAARGAKRAPTVWYLGADGKPVQAKVTAGFSDGQKTAITSDVIKPGMQVIVGTASGDQAGAAASSSATTASPFQQQQQRRGPPPGGI